MHDLVSGFAALYVVHYYLHSVPREPVGQAVVLGCVHIHSKTQP